MIDKHYNGDRDKWLTDMLRKSYDKLPKSGVFREFATINGKKIWVLGSIIDGIPKIGTIWIKH